MTCSGNPATCGWDICPIRPIVCYKIMFAREAARDGTLSFEDYQRVMAIALEAGW